MFLPKLQGAVHASVFLGCDQPPSPAIRCNLSLKEVPSLCISPVISQISVREDCETEVNLAQSLDFWTLSSENIITADSIQEKDAHKVKNYTFSNSLSDFSNQEYIL